MDSNTPTYLNNKCALGKSENNLLHSSTHLHETEEKNGSLGF